jgi:ubiquinone/menaquinone biosynthesis C-methylase UbiE
MNPLSVRIYEFSLKFRDLFLNPSEILKEIPIKANMNILDYGCGPGIYSNIIAPRILPLGKIYIIDIEPNMIKRVMAKAKKLGNTNIEPLSKMAQLPDASIDLVLNLDMIHFVKDPSPLIKEYRRILKPTGILAVSDHHLTNGKILQIFTNGNIFHEQNKGKFSIQFQKNT